MHFYLEYPTQAAKRNKSGNPTVLVKTSKWDYQYERGSWADAVTCESGRTHFTTTSIEKAYIRKYCRRITESMARMVCSEIFNCGLL